MQKRFEFRMWHGLKKYMYFNVAIGAGAESVGYKLSGAKKYIWENSPDLTTMQYTGFKDSKGKKIFEGDIVEFGKRKPYKAVVEWNEYRLAFRKPGNKKHLDKFAQWQKVGFTKVLGNIHENPELLKKTSKKD